MKNLCIAWMAAVVSSLILFSQSGFTQGTAFTYQGRLNGPTGPLSGSYDFLFSLYNTNSAGTQLGGNEQTNGVAVSNGLFTVVIDFGNQYGGQSCWLDIQVRTNGTVTFYDIGARQDLTAVPYAVYAGTASNAVNSSAFSGSLAGDVTGTQSSTVVTTVGGQTAANVAAGAVVANNASNLNTASTIVKRDGSGGFLAGTVTGSGFTGSGAGLTNLNASSVTTGTLPSTVLPAGLAQLGTSQTFTGVNTFANQVNISPGNGSLSITNDAGIVPGIVANGGNAPGHMRFRSSLEIWPNFPPTNSGYLDVRNTNGNATIVLNGQNGSVTAGSFAGDGSQLTGISSAALGGNDLTTLGGEPGLSTGTNIYLNDEPIYLRFDQNHGLAYNGYGVTNFPSLAVQPDGPVLWGYTGGALGQLNGGAAAALSWNNSGVDIANALTVGGGATIGGAVTAASISAGTLTAANTAGLNYFQNGNEDVTVTTNGAVNLGSMGNLKPSTGVFVITAYADIAFNETEYSAAYLQLYDVTTSSTLLTQVLDYPAQQIASGTVSLTWVFPVSSAGGYENFALVVQAQGSSITVTSHNMTVMFFPRQNN